MVVCLATHALKASKLGKCQSQVEAASRQREGREGRLTKQRTAGPSAGAGPCARSEHGDPSPPLSRPRRSTAAASCGNLLRVAAVGLEKGADASLGTITRQGGKASRQKAESSASLGLGCATAVRSHSRLLANSSSKSFLSHADAGA
jgi:hypothetical protein